MTSVLGYRLEDAMEILQQEGYRVFAMEISSRKGVVGNEKRIIRQTLHVDGTDACEVHLVYAVFQTDCNKD